MNENETRYVQEALDALKRASRILEDMGDGEINRAVTETYGSTMWFRCGCGTPVNYGDKFCRMCGREIKW